MTKVVPTKKTAPASKHTISSEKKVKLPGGAQKVLNVIAAISLQKETKEVSRDDIATLVGTQYGITGKSTVANAFTQLKNTGLARVEPKFVELTNKGMEQADTSELTISIPKNTQEYLDSMKELHKLKDKQSKILDLLVDGEPHSKKEVAAAIGCEMNSTFANLLTGLKKAGTINLLGKEIQLTSEMRKYE